MITVRYILQHPTLDFCWFHDIDSARGVARELPGSTLDAYTYEDEAAEPILKRRVHVSHKES